MGGRGTFASGKSVAYTYETVGKIENVKILIGKDGQAKGFTRRIAFEQCIYPITSGWQIQNFSERKPRLMTNQEYEKYKKYFKGLNK